MGKTAKSKSKDTPFPMTFPMEHSIRYGLKPMERHSDIGYVISVRCQFCVYFGREEIRDASVKERIHFDNLSLICLWKTLCIVNSMKVCLF